MASARGGAQDAGAGDDHALGRTSAHSRPEDARTKVRTRVVESSLGSVPPSGTNSNDQFQEQQQLQQNQKHTQHQQRDARQSGRQDVAYLQGQKQHSQSPHFYHYQTGQRQHQQQPKLFQPRQSGFQGSTESSVGSGRHLGGVAVRGAKSSHGRSRSLQHQNLVQSRGGARPTIGGALSGSNMAPVSQASASLVTEQQQAPELPSPQNSSSTSSSSSSPKFPTGTSATKQPVDVSLSGSGAGNRRHSGSSATTPPPPLKQHPRKLKERLFNGPDGDAARAAESFIIGRIVENGGTGVPSVRLDQDVRSMLAQGPIAAVESVGGLERFCILSDRLFCKEKVIFLHEQFAKKFTRAMAHRGDPVDPQLAAALAHHHQQQQQEGQQEEQQEEQQTSKATSHQPQHGSTRRRASLGTTGGSTGASRLHIRSSSQSLSPKLRASSAKISPSNTYNSEAGTSDEHELLQALRQHLQGEPFLSLDSLEKSSHWTQTFSTQYGSLINYLYSHPDVFALENDTVTLIPQQHQVQYPEPPPHPLPEQTSHRDSLASPEVTSSVERQEYHAEQSSTPHNPILSSKSIIGNRNDPTAYVTRAPIMLGETAARAAFAASSEVPNVAHTSSPATAMFQSHRQTAHSDKQSTKTSTTSKDIAPPSTAGLASELPVVESFMTEEGSQSWADM